MIFHLHHRFGEKLFLVMPASASMFKDNLAGGPDDPFHLSVREKEVSKCL
jgi:hypothetical protein